MLKWKGQTPGETQICMQKGPICITWKTWVSAFNHYQKIKIDTSLTESAKAYRICFPNVERHRCRQKCSSPAPCCSRVADPRCADWPCLLLSSPSFLSCSCSKLLNYGYPSPRVPPFFSLSSNHLLAPALCTMTLPRTVALALLLDCTYSTSQHWAGCSANGINAVTLRTCTGGFISRTVERAPWFVQLARRRRRKWG